MPIDNRDDKKIFLTNNLSRNETISKLVNDRSQRNTLYGIWRRHPDSILPTKKN